MAQSSTDIAYKYLKDSKEELPFATIWNIVCQEKGYDGEKRKDLISSFYTDLLLDGRFITLGENKWALREDHAFDKVHIDMNAVYANDEIIEGEEGYIEKADLLIDEDDDEYEAVDDQEEDTFEIASDIAEKEGEDYNSEYDVDDKENLQDELEIVEDTDETD